MNHVSIDLRNDLDDLPKLTRMLALWGEQFRIPETAIRHLELALEEIVTNVISYAYSDDAGHLIRVNVRMEGRRITAMVEDDGVSFNPLERDAPDTTATIENREIGGLGIHLVRELMDDVRYDRIGSRNRLTLVKAIGPA